MTAPAMSVADRLEQIGRRAYSTMHTIRASYGIAHQAIRAEIPGDFIECGVAAGSNAAAMALAIIEHQSAYAPPRRVHLFDSFTGIPLAGPEDVEFLAAKHPAGLTAHSEAEVRRNMREWGIPDELLVYHPGMFADTLPGGVEQITILRLDGDLYESTKVCLDHLMPLVSLGGWVIVDDWDLSGARKAVMDYMGHGFGPIAFQQQHAR